MAGCVFFWKQAKDSLIGIISRYIHGNKHRRFLKPNQPNNYLTLQQI